MARPSSSPSTSSTDLVPLAGARSGGGIPIAQMHRVYRCDEVEQRLAKLPPKEHESLRCTYARAALQVTARGYVLETGAAARRGAAHELLDDPRVIETYLGTGKATA